MLSLQPPQAKTGSKMADIFIFIFYENETDLNCDTGRVPLAPAELQKGPTKFINRVKLIQY